MTPKTDSDVPVVSVVAKSSVGKMAALEPIVRELARRGHCVGTIKHDAHGFDMDRPAKDSWRHAQAGNFAGAAICAGRRLRRRRSAGNTLFAAYRGGAI